MRLDVELGLPSDDVFRTGDFADALDYAAVVKRLQAFAADHPHQLLERFAQAIADLLMSEFGAPWVKVRVAKLAPIAGVKELGIVDRAQARADGAARARPRDVCARISRSAPSRRRGVDGNVNANVEPAPDLARHPDPAAVELDELARDARGRARCLRPSSPRCPTCRNSSNTAS